MNSSVKSFAIRFGLDCIGHLHLWRSFAYSSVLPLVTDRRPKKGFHEDGLRNFETEMSDRGFDRTDHGTIARNNNFTSTVAKV